MNLLRQKPPQSSPVSANQNGKAIQSPGNSGNDLRESCVVSYNLPYYHPEICNMQQIKEAMEPFRLTSGYFLLRNSFSQTGAFTLSVMHQTGLKHIKIEADAKSFYLKDIRFPTISNLIDYYSSHEVPNTEGISDVRLRHPIKFQPNLSRQISDEGIYLQADISEPVTIIKSQRETIQPAPYRDAGVPSMPPPAIPRPRPQPELPSVQQKIYEKDYEKIDDRRGPMIESLKDHLMNESEEGGVCDCGLNLEDAELPRGWSLHICNDNKFQDEIFFMSPDRTSHWNLPLNIMLELTADQQDRIRNKIFDFETKSGRTAMANRYSMDTTGMSQKRNSTSITSKVPSENPPCKIGTPITPGYQIAIRKNSTDSAGVGGYNRGEPESGKVTSPSGIARSESNYTRMDRSTIIRNNNSD